MVCLTVTEVMHREMIKKLKRGLTQYLKDIRWKKALDKIQRSFSCCGVYGYRDWFDSPWISVDHLRLSSEGIQS
jgi:hypothetical protein